MIYEQQSFLTSLKREKKREALPRSMTTHRMPSKDNLILISLGSNPRSIFCELGKAPQGCHCCQFSRPFPVVSSMSGWCDNPKTLNAKHPLAILHALVTVRLVLRRYGYDTECNEVNCFNLKLCAIVINCFWLVGLVVGCNGFSLILLGNSEPFSVGLVDQLFQMTSNH